MTKRDAIKLFREEVLPFVIAKYGTRDKPAIREAWNDWTDGLCKDRIITQAQYNNWTTPF